MAAEPMLTFERVAAVAEALLADGVEPSQRRVRAELGDRGSFSTLGQFLKRWRDQRAQQSAAPLSDALLTQIRDEIEARVVNRTADLRARLAAAEQDLGDAVEETRRLRERHAALEQDYAAEHDRHEAATARAAVLTERVAVLDAACEQSRAAAEQCRRDVADAKVRRQVAEQMAATATHELRTARDALAARQARVEALLTEQSAMRARLSATDAELAAARDKLLALEQAQASSTAKAVDLTHVVTSIYDELRQRIETERRGREITEAKLLEILGTQLKSSTRSAKRPATGKSIRRD